MKATFHSSPILPSYVIKNRPTLSIISPYIHTTLPLESQINSRFIVRATHQGITPTETPPLKTNISVARSIRIDPLPRSLYQKQGHARLDASIVALGKEYSPLERFMNNRAALTSTWAKSIDDVRVVVSLPPPHRKRPTRT